MNKSLLIVSLIGLISAFYIIQHNEETASKPNLIDQVSDSTVALVYQADNKDLSIENNIHPICSGVWISSTEILTAYHCVKRLQEIAQAKQESREQASDDEPACDPLGSALGLCIEANEIVPKKISLNGLSVHYVMQNEIEGLDREPNGIHLSKVVKWDKAHDLAMLKIVGHGINHTVAKLAEKNPTVGTEIIVCGHTNGFYWSVLHGWVSGYRDQIPGWKVEGPFMQVQAPIFHGNSGGGAFNEEGKLVGIAEMMMAEIPNMSMFVGLDTLKEFVALK